VTTTGIVLAGGRSRRFGGDKLVATLDGATLLSAAVASVAPLVDGVIVAVAELPDEFLEAEVPVALVHDRESFGGPVAALASVLDSVVEPDEADLAIVVGGDMPRLVTSVLGAMLELLRADLGIRAVVLEVPDARRRQVLPLALRVAPAQRAARELLALEDRSLRGLADRLDAAELPAAIWRPLDPGGETLVDVDTKEDLERLRSARAGDARLG
jgi:molybdopterin-guanine dinucleotide biosynthesis protein A